MQDFECQQRLHKSLMEHGLDEQAAKMIVDEVADCGFWREHGASEHLEAQLQACLSNRSTTIDGTAGGIRMLRGTGAGNPLADLLFTVAFSKVTRRLKAALDAEGLLHSFKVPGARDSLGIGPSEADGVADSADMGDGSYADDLACAVGTAAVSVMTVIQTVGVIAWRIYE